MKDGGWILPDPVDPGTRKCICIPVPDSPEHRQAFFGALIQLGYQFNWQRDEDKNAVPTSVLWFDIISQAMQRFYSDEVYMCFSCEELKACIGPLMKQLINESKYGTDAQPGVPMSPERRSRDLAAGTNPTCDPDITWAQAQQIAEYGDSLIRAALALAESATNDTELSSVISSLPGLDELGIDAIFGYINLLQEGIAENYYAQANDTYLEGVACAIFCLGKEDCEISADDIYKVFYDRAVGHFGTPVGAITTIVDLMAYLIDQDIDGTVIADVLMMIVFGGGVLAEVFLGDVGTKQLEVLLKLAVNDANNDWELLCDVCPVTPNIVLMESYPGVIINNPVFLSNTGSGGSIWEATYFDQGGGAFAVALDAQIAGLDTCIKLISAAPVDSHQHQQCSGGLISGAGDGASPPDIDSLGFIRSSGGTITIEVEPI